MRQVFVPLLLAAALSVGGCSDDGPDTIDGFPAHISPDGIGGPPEWVPVFAPEDQDVFAREADLAEGQAGVYNRDGDLVGTFSKCPGGRGGFNDPGEKPSPCPSTTTR